MMQVEKSCIGLRKTYKWAATWQNKQSDCAPSEDSDEPRHPPSPIRVSAVHMKKACVLSYTLSAQRRLWSDWADAQTDLSLRLAHGHFVGFVMLRRTSSHLFLLKHVCKCGVYTVMTDSRTPVYRKLIVFAIKHSQFLASKSALNANGLTNFFYQKFGFAMSTVSHNMSNHSNKKQQHKKKIESDTLQWWRMFTLDIVEDSNSSTC